jgi:hypothetical protein
LWKGRPLLLLFVLLLEFDEELGVVLYLVVNVLFTAGVLLAAERRRVLEVDSAVLTVKVWHYYYINIL